MTPLLRGGKRHEVKDGVHVYRVLAPSMADYSFVPFVRQTNIVLERAARRIQKKVGEIDLIDVYKRQGPSDRGHRTCRNS